MPEGRLQRTRNAYVKKPESLGLNSNEVTALRYRFGMTTGRPETYAAIGRAFAVTDGRARSVVQSGLKKLNGRNFSDWLADTPEDY